MTSSEARMRTLDPTKLLSDPTRIPSDLRSDLSHRVSPANDLTSILANSLLSTPNASVSSLSALQAMWGTN